MPKRKLSEEDVIAKKLRRLEKKLRKCKNRRKRIISSTSEDSERSTQNITDGVNVAQSHDDTDIDSILCEIEDQHQDASLLISNENEPKRQEQNLASTVECVLEDTVLDSEILELLGDDPTNTIVYGKEIRPELATRFNHIATNGLNKEMRKELYDKYPKPGNCTLIGAPILNPEVKIALNENVTRRDKLIELRQNRIATAISCIGEVLSSILSAKEKDKAQIKCLMDTGRIICDIQYNETVSRRNLAIMALKKEMKEPLLNTKTDKYLFGENLSEVLKTAKAVNKSGTELKTQFKPQTKNWKIPVASRRQTATNRRGTPAAPMTTSHLTTPAQLTPAASQARATRAYLSRRPPPPPPKSARRRY